MITKYDLISILVKEYEKDMQHDIRIMLSREKDSFFESQLPVKAIRKGYFVIA